ncbi:hypothetical protein HYALB_00012536 [Hymenoscyphus albidus]|uniref:Heterokaryon incompatibility domain-containing protein n=1 Tax=Hymenoscyphus albidus TaxID=595503 RepID=A0A9N9LQ53_9HELO|nr:hypothetical protein HYALB_00012536 [Hymenoscyphus albidus]
MEYRPLDDAKDEIRILRLKPSYDPSEMLECELVHVSLQDFTKDYQHHASQHGHASNFKTWIKSRVGATDSDTTENDGRLIQVPGDHEYRFQWGELASLSYAWGTSLETRAILVNGATVQVTINLEAALRALGRTSIFADRYMLWVDALCINRQDFDERSKQVQKMRHIYSFSRAVVAWVGEEYDESEKALDLVEMLAGVYEDSEKGWMLRASYGDDAARFSISSWVSLERFMRRWYWERLWVIQELALGASRAYIYMWSVKDRLLEYDMSFLERGNIDSLGYPGILSESIQGTMNIGQSPSIHLEKSQAPTTTTTSTTQGWSSGDNLKHVYKDLWRLSQREMNNEPILELWELLHVAKSSLCKDNRDKIHGLLALIDPGISRDIIPDYTVDPKALFTSVARLVISKSDGLDILREGYAWSELGIPSWVPDWTWSGRIRDSRPKVSYCATRAMRASFAFMDDGFRLKCKGIIFDQIDGLGSHEASRFQWPEESVKNPNHNTSPYGSATATREAFCRAMIMDRKALSKTSSSGGCEEIFYLPSCTVTAMQKFKELEWNRFALDGRYYPRWENWRKGNNHLWMGDRYLSDYFSDEIPKAPLEDDYWDAYQSWTRTVTARRLLVTTKGYFGWAPDFRGDSEEEQTIVGDLICFVFGCSVPLIIRLADEGTGGLYKVVGEAYVEGLMNGEVLELSDVNSRYHILLSDGDANCDRLTDIEAS